LNGILQRKMPNRVGKDADAVSDQAQGFAAIPETGMMQKLPAVPDFG
jgi:hypothetical protein